MEADRPRKMLLELGEYEHDLPYPWASPQIAIDMEDGLKAHYPAFDLGLTKITGWGLPMAEIEPIKGQPDSVFVRVAALVEETRAQVAARANAALNLIREAEKKDTKDAVLFNGAVRAWGDVNEQARKFASALQPPADAARVRFRRERGLGHASQPT